MKKRLIEYKHAKKGQGIKFSKKIVALLLIVIVASVGVVAAIGYLMTSNSVTITPIVPTLTLAASTLAPVAGVTIVTLTATCSDSSFTGMVAFDFGNTTVVDKAAVAGVAICTSYFPNTTPVTVTASATHT